MSEVYESGAVDPYIRIALDRAARVREIYRRVANVQHPDEWHPVQVICETCGRIGTTIVTRWDGERVYYECRPDLVEWARGCGRSGWVVPFGGRAKLGWNLEWAAQWSIFGVTIEPCGKDLSTAGGSRDRSDAIAREIFEREPPLNFPYEFLNIGGHKMSTSKGRGATAHQMAEVVPPEQLRFLFIRPRPNSAIEFDPDGTAAIPRLFDEFDRVADAAAGREVKGSLPPSPERLFAYASLVDRSCRRRGAGGCGSARLRPRRLPCPAAGHRPAVRAPPRRRAPRRVRSTSRSSASERSRRDAGSRPMRRTMPGSGSSRRLPDAADELDTAQRAFLRALADDARTAEGGLGAGWQETIFRVAKDLDLPPGRAFEAIYRAFLGRTSGPRAGWLLASLDRPFVIARLDEASGMVAAGEAR